MNKRMSQQLSSATQDANAERSAAFLNRIVYGIKKSVLIGIVISLTFAMTVVLYRRFEARILAYALETKAQLHLEIDRVFTPVKAALSSKLELPLKDLKFLSTKALQMIEVSHDYDNLRALRLHQQADLKSLVAPEGQIEELSVWRTDTLSGTPGNTTSNTMKPLALWTSDVKFQASAQPLMGQLHATEAGDTVDLQISEVMRKQLIDAGWTKWAARLTPEQLKKSAHAIQDGQAWTVFSENIEIEGKTLTFIIAARWSLPNWTQLLSAQGAVHTLVISRDGKVLTQNNPPFLPQTGLFRGWIEDFIRQELNEWSFDAQDMMVRFFRPSGWENLFLLSYGVGKNLVTAESNLQSFLKATSEGSDWSKKNGTVFWGLLFVLGQSLGFSFVFGNWLRRRAKYVYKASMRRRRHRTKGTVFVESREAEAAKQEKIITIVEEDEEKVPARLDSEGARIEEGFVIHGSVRGISKLFEKEPAEQVASTLNEYFTLASLRARSRQGHFERYAGSSFLIWWPSSETSVWELMQCALELRKDFFNLNEARKVDGFSSLYFGMGADAGRMLYARLGASGHQFPAVVGDCLSAARALDHLSAQHQLDFLLSQRIWSTISSQAVGALMGETKLTTESGLFNYYRLDGYRDEQGQAIRVQTPEQRSAPELPVPEPTCMTQVIEKKFFPLFPRQLKKYDAIEVFQISAKVFSTEWSSDQGGAREPNHSVWIKAVESHVPSVTAPSEASMKTPPQPPAKPPLPSSKVTAATAAVGSDLKAA